MSFSCEIALTMRVFRPQIAPNGKRSNAKMLVSTPPEQSIVEINLESQWQNFLSISQTCTNYADETLPRDF